MGFIHYNCTIAEQAAAVAKVKAHCPGFVVTPICMKPTDTVSALDNLKVGTGNSKGEGRTGCGELEMRSDVKTRQALCLQCREQWRRLL